MVPRGLLTAVACAWAFGCRQPSTAVDAGGGPILARWDGGVVTESELLREAARLPPALRGQYESPAGRAEFLRTVVDKHLLFAEARRRGLVEGEDIQRQVRQLEERLAIQALLAEEERHRGPPSDDEARAAWAAHPEEWRVPARARGVRLWVLAGKGEAAAKARLAGLVQRVKKGEAPRKVAEAADGPERLNGGDTGWVTSTATPEGAALLALKGPGEASPPLSVGGGWAVLVLVEKQEARTPPFEEVRGAVVGRLTPGRQREAYDALLRQVRAGADVKLEAAAK